jgi:hypothetical protein
MHNFCEAKQPNKEKFISDLYLNRKAPVIPFKDNIISVCEDLNSSDAMNTFFKDLKVKEEFICFFTKLIQIFII